MTQNKPNPQVPVQSEFQPYQPPPAQPQKNTIGRIAMIIAIVGFIFACIPGALIIGWVLLPIAFILAIVGLTRTGQKKGTSIAALILSIVGTIVGFVVFLTVVTDAVDDAFSDIDGGELEASTSDSDSDAATELSDADTGDAVSDEADNRVDDANDEPGTRDNPYAIGDEVQN